MERDVLVRKNEVVVLISFENGSTNILHKWLVWLIDVLIRLQEALEFEKKASAIKAEREVVHILEELFGLIVILNEIVSFSIYEV